MDIYEHSEVKLWKKNYKINDITECFWIDFKHIYKKNKFAYIL
jgi:hypothetical protein